MSEAIRWKPKEGEVYYTCVTSYGAIIISTNICEDDMYDRAKHRLGNCFRTKKEAQAVARKLRTFWKDVREVKI